MQALHVQTWRDHLLYTAYARPAAKSAKNQESFNLSRFEGYTSCATNQTFRLGQVPRPRVSKTKIPNLPPSLLRYQDLRDRYSPTHKTVHSMAAGRVPAPGKISLGQPTPECRAPILSGARCASSGRTTALGVSHPEGYWFYTVRRVVVTSIDKQHETGR
jgi:hypothetical protein